MSRSPVQELGLEHVSVFFQEAETQNLDMQLVPPQAATMVDATGAGSYTLTTACSVCCSQSCRGAALQVTPWSALACGGCARECRCHRAWDSGLWPLLWLSDATQRCQTR